MDLRVTAMCAAVWGALLRASPPTPFRRAPGVDHDGERGQGLAEYALILAGVAIVVIGALILLGTNIRDYYIDPVVSALQEVIDNL